MKHLAIAEYFINIGKAILILAFAKFMYDETGQIWQISLTFLAEVVTSSLLPLIIGKAVDEHGVRRILVGSAAGHVLFCLIGVGLIYKYGATASLLLMISVSLSLLWPISRMALFSITPQLSSEAALEKDNGKLTTAFQAGQFTGMVAAAWLLDQFGFIVILGLTTVIYFIATVFYITATQALKVKESSKVQKQDDAANHVSFIELVKQSKPFIPAFFLSNFDFVTVAIFNILLVSVVAINFDGSTYWLAGLDAAYAIGAMFGGLVVARQFRGKKTSIRDVMLIQFLFLGYLIISVNSSAKYLMILAIVLVGGFQSFSGIYWRTYLQTHMPSHIIGRLTGIKYIISSFHIGLIVMIVSFAHEISFDMAIFISIALTAFQIVMLIIHKQNSDKKKALVQAQKIGIVVDPVVAKE
ncbi:MFS transporter [Rheinheimera sp. WS51]|uniref:MFS transporter n=1 Tax=Rheinheimera sp. WS51 TaxID=3425886 RepID=UPI003D8DBE3B